MIIGLFLIKKKVLKYFRDIKRMLNEKKYEVKLANKRGKGRHSCPLKTQGHI